MIRSELGQGNTAEAHRLFDSMLDQGIPRDAVLYNILLRSSSNDTERLSTLMQQMSAEGVTATARTYNTIMSVSSHQECNRLFKQMKRDGVAPDAGTFNILIKKAGVNFVRIDSLFERMTRDFDIHPNDYTYSSLFKACRMASKQQSKHRGKAKSVTVITPQDRACTYMEQLIREANISLDDRQFAFARDAASLVLGRETCDQMCVDAGASHLTRVDSVDSFGSGRNTSNMLAEKKSVHSNEKNNEATTTEIIRSLKHYDVPRGEEKLSSSLSLSSSSGLPERKRLSKFDRKRQGRVLRHYNKTLKTALKSGTNIGGANTNEKRMKRARFILSKMEKEGVMGDAVTYTTLMRGRMESVGIRERFVLVC